ncbi:hypothetical protein [Roseateles violae]|uniref:Uncharacterized protein n=1 Tax=Roseateles violae TaxID=3058042 RepID=A0ABT8DXK2_9BURK|nr:hypothetical protein [Pelomonas sp. PFR6]MDN3922243.1 hypothetical protein [Pelomonas sp. PFR6]
MRRRGLLKLGLGATVLLGLAGGGLALLKPGLGKDGHLSAESRALLGAVALALMDGLWPADALAREADLARYLDRLDGSIAGLPAALRGDLSQLLSLLGSSGGRLALSGLAADWSRVPTTELQAALDAMRVSGSDTRQQVYRALRDLGCLVFFAEPAHARLAGYPGPREIP